MYRRYWLDRMRASMKMARRAATAESRLIHYDMAGRYSIKAASALPFLVTRKEPATTGESEALRLPHSIDPGRNPAPPARPKRGGRGGEAR